MDSIWVRYLSGAQHPLHAPSNSATSNAFVSRAFAISASIPLHVASWKALVTWKQTRPPLPIPRPLSDMRICAPERVKLYNLLSILLIISGTFNKTAMEITFSVGKHSDDQPCVNTRQFQINLAYTLTALLQWRSTFASSRCRSFQCIRIASIQNAVSTPCGLAMWNSVNLCEKPARLSLSVVYNSTALFESNAEQFFFRFLQPFTVIENFPGTAKTSPPNHLPSWPLSFWWEWRTWDMVRIIRYW